MNFEQWLSRRMDQAGARISATTSFKIPVVFHVIHNGEAVGSGTNISEAQILSQIKVLNNDFRRLNADTTKTPTEFSSVAGKINIEFVLAKQSPTGISTNGIERVKGTKKQWSMNDNNTLKGLSYWPAEDYLNIWITDLASTILGYAQFPVSNLAGLEDAEDNRLTDGVVLDYRIVGSSQDGSFNLTESFNRGRTATHEVGHFFGLRHIWGDDEGACRGYGDYVDDTPDQGNSSDGCPSHPQISCNTGAMFQNYMDYTNDVCMNLYTIQQIERMLTVLENSPRRASLLTSDGVYDPAPVNNDLAIKEIASPRIDECNTNVIPAIIITNNGKNKVTSAKVRFIAVSKLIEEKVVSFEGLDPDEETVIVFASYGMEPGTTDFDFEIVETNSSDDGKPNDNIKSITSEVPDLISTPLTENFNVMPSPWRISNADGQTTWSIIETGAINNVTNKALYMKFFQSQETNGENDIITTPVIDLSKATSPFLAFDVAYGHYQSRSDGLEVHVLLNCKGNLADGDIIYSKYGSELATVSTTISSFSPAHENQWRREVIDLREFIGQEHVQLAFVGINDHGNNLYVDNMSVRTDVSENIAAVEVINPPVQCNNAVRLSLLVENKGSLLIQNFKISYTVNSGTTETLSTSDNLNLLPGSQMTITLPSINLSDAGNSIFFEIALPNGFKDMDTTDNSLTVKTVVNRDEDILPLRNNFDNKDSENAWQIINPVSDHDWETISTNYNQSLYFKGDTTFKNMGSSWFVSPVLDLSNVTTASLFFDLSCRYENLDQTTNAEQQTFQVRASRDCGQTFEEVLFTNSENALASSYGSQGGVPVSSNDWSRIYLNLNSLAGEENVRIAFVVSSEASNSIYLDNIEFFLSDDPTPVIISDLYSLYPNNLVEAKSFYLTFNLLNRQHVTYELIDMLGKRVGAKELTDVLNQTFKVDVEDASNGVYLVRLLIDKKYYVSRIVVNQ